MPPCCCWVKTLVFEADADSGLDSVTDVTDVAVCLASVDFRS